MKRRTLLSGVATGTALLAGCLARGNEDDGGNEPAADDGDSPADVTPSVEASTIVTTAADCGTTDVGTATAHRAEGTVAVEGTIGASNPCHEAVLVGTEIQNRQLVLRVDVESTGDICEQCLGAVDYTATVYVANAQGLHGTTVEHVGGDEHVTNWTESGTRLPESVGAVRIDVPATGDDTLATPSCGMPRRSGCMIRAMPGTIGRSTRVENHQPARRFRANDNA